MNFETDVTRGLTESEANEKLAVDGQNVLKEKPKKTWIQRFLGEFKDAMIIILLVAAAISLVIAFREGTAESYFEPALIILIVVINAIMGVTQEGKAEKSLEALKSMSAPHARVIRDGKERVIDAKNLVKGDIIKLEAGDYVPADAKLIKSSSLKSEESALTGESIAVIKDATAKVPEDAPIGDKCNMVFSGCSITYGTAIAVVTATGMDTEMGKIATLIENEIDTDTPLQHKLAQLGKILGAAAIGICLIIFIIGIIDGIPLIEIFMTAVSLAVSAIPEGLPVIVTIVLSIGVEQMAKHNAIVKKLPAVETLGCTSIICSDKTGTLTQNKMTLVKAYFDETEELADITDNNSDAVRMLLAYGTLCSDGTVEYSENKENHIGDPTETSIIAAAHKNGIIQSDINDVYKRLAELPFDSDRKLMTSINMIDGRITVITKGAYDMMEKICVSGNFEKATKIVDELSSEALRVLAIGYKVLDNLPDTLNYDEIENDLTLLGLVGMIDPPREEAKEAVAVCKKAGIRPIMITGDHVVTAGAIAKQLGIMNDGDKAITGSELSKMTDEKFDHEITKISVYARVSPEDKIRVIKGWKRQDKIVSMTGDGVNDAPALKAADIGCAMGITGTDVAKGAADMTLMDDNFATIVSAVKQGRGIYSNIKRTVGFLLGTNIGEVLVVFVSMLLWGKSPLLSMQLLWVNLVTDSLPAIALGMEPIDDSVMDESPRPKKEGIFAGGLGFRICLQGIMFGALSLFAFWLGQTETGTLKGGRTLAFMVLAFCQIVQVFNMRSDKSLFKIGFFTNHKLNQAALVSIFMMIIVLFIPPIAKIFGLMMLPVWLYIVGIALSFISLVVIEIEKAIRK